MLRLQEQVTGLHRENGELRGRLEELRVGQGLLREQLAAKDAQIKASEANLQRALALASRSAA